MNEGLPAGVVRFAGFLRRAGVSVGSGQVVDAVRALELVGVSSRRDVFWALHSVLISRREHHELFGYAFAVFWRDLQGEGDELARLELPDHGERVPQRRLPRRVLEAWAAERSHRVVRPTSEDLDAPGTASWRERLRRRDFEQMSVEELTEAKRLLRRLRFPWRERPTRRYVCRPRGPALDLRRTLQRSLRTAGEPLSLVRRARARRPPPLVVLCDISGSMERYSRMVLHFLHALTNDRDRVEVFVFGTRLTRITRSLQLRDVDAAFAELSARVADWGGGTRIASCLDTFQRRWARRVLTGNPELLLITDGLERRDPEAPADELELEVVLARLARSVRTIRWLNPLLRYEGFEAETPGTKTLLAHVTDHRPVHDLESLEALAVALAR